MQQVLTSKQQPDNKPDKAQEIERIYKIISPLSIMQGKSFYLCLPMPDGSSYPYKLTTLLREGEQARSWVLNRFREQYKYSPQISSFNSAVAQVHSYLMSHPQQEKTPEATFEEDERENRQTKKDKRILEVADYSKPASDANVSYARVREAGELMGMWRLNGYKTVRLIDTHVQVKRVVRPHSKSKNARYSTVTLLFTNSKGKEKLIEVTDEQLTSNELSNKLKGFARYVQTDRERRHFAEFIDALASEEGVQVQDNTDELAWYKSDDGTLPWGMINGAELSQRFVESDESPCIPPHIPSPGAMYYGANIDLSKLSTEYDFYKLWLNQYAPSIDCQVIFLAMMGLNMLVSLPEGIVPPGSGVENGTLRIAPEIVGSPDCGKNRSLNAHLCENGTQFYFNTPVLLTSVGGGRGDTGLGRNGLMAAMRYQPFIDFDYKAKPEGKELKDFEAQHKQRNDKIANYVDGPTGGAKSSRTGELRGRDIPGGCIWGTCNYDHAAYSIDEGDDMIESRACTFVWKKDVKGNLEISKLMDREDIRLQPYLMGQKRRNWLREKLAQCPEELRETVKFCYDMARGAVDDSRHTWYSDRHRNQTVLIVWGCYLIQEFLSEAMPDYFLHEWVNRFIPLLIENRVKRSAYIQKLIDEKKEQSSIDRFVVDTLRYNLSLGSLYARSQSDKLLKEDDLDGFNFDIDKLGYKSAIRGIDEERVPSHQAIAIGYLILRKKAIAFNKSLLLDFLRREASKKNITLGGDNQVSSALAEKQVTISTRNKKGEVTRHDFLVWVKGKPDWYFLIPTSVLYPEVESISDEEEDEEAQGEERDLPGDISPLGEPEASPDVFTQESIELLV